MARNTTATSILTFLFVFITLTACEPQPPAEVRWPAAKTAGSLDSIQQKQRSFQIQQSAEDLGLQEVTEYSNEPTFNISLPPKQLCDENLLITLTPKLSGIEEEQIQQARWVQVDGPELAIIEPNNLSTRIIAPSVQKAETVTLRLSTQSNDGVLQAATTKLEVHPLESGFNVASVMATEGDVALAFTVQLTKPADQALTLHYTTENNQARDDNDFQAASGSLEIPQGESSAEIIISLNDDEFREAAELFKLNLSTVIDGVAINKTAYGVILDDELGEISIYEEPKLSFSESDIDEVHNVNSLSHGYFLTWNDPNTILRLAVVDDCLNEINSTNPIANCDGQEGQFIFTEEGSELSQQETIGFKSTSLAIRSFSIAHQFGGATDFKLIILDAGKYSSWVGRIGEGVEHRVNFEDLSLDNWRATSAESRSSDQSSSAYSSSEVALSPVSSEASSHESEQSKSSSSESHIINMEQPKNNRLAVSDSHGLFVTTNGNVLSWGANWARQSDVPVDLDNVVSVAAGNGFSIALRKNGTLVAWGDIGEFEFSASSENFEGEINKLENVRSIAAGDRHVLLLREKGELLVWGENNYGLFDVPSGLDKGHSIAAGKYHNMVLDQAGKVYVWGRNYVQADVEESLPKVVKVAASDQGSFILTEDGRVRTIDGNKLNNSSHQLLEFFVGNDDKFGIDVTGRFIRLANEWEEEKCAACVQVLNNLDPVEVVIRRGTLIALLSNGQLITWSIDDADMVSLDLINWAKITGVQRVSSADDNPLYLKKNGKVS